MRALARLVACLMVLAVSAAQSAKAAVEYPAATVPDVARALEALPALPGAGLFTPPGASGAKDQAASTAEAPASAILRERVAAVNPGYLDAIIGAQPLALDASGAVTGETQRLTLNLFDNLIVTAVKLSESRSPLGPRIIRAAVTGGGYATLVVENGTVTADIAANGRQVMVRPLNAGANGLHRITEAREPSADDIKRKPPRPATLTPPPSGTEQSGIEKPSATTPTEIRILIVYTRDAKAALTSVRASIALMMDALNTTLANSGVNATATLAGIDMFRDNDATSVTSDTLLDHMRDQVGDFARIETLRAAVGADLVSLISAFDEAGSSAGSAVCGRGWLNDDLDSALLAAHTGYGGSVISTAPTCLPNMASSFAHEVGHNLGASHDRFTEPTLAPGPGFYAAGYVDLTGRFRDTMSYANKCSANNVTCTRVPYYSNPNLTYNGRPLGIADRQPDAADASRRIGEIAPYVARLHQFLTPPATPVLSMVVSGTGTITSAPTGLACGDTCSASFTTGTSVTLTAAAPAGWGFKQWAGACSGAGTCTVAMSTSKSVTAVFLPTVYMGPVFSTAQGSSQSFIRFANTGSSAGTATIRVSDYATGALLGVWTSPSIPAGAALQYGIGTIESVVTAATKPQYYAFAVQTDMSGTTQHVLWKPSDATFTNLSTCDAGIGTGAGQVASVHSSLLSAIGYPSSLAINNANASAASGVTLGIYDARNGTRLGAYPVAAIPANAKLVVPMSDIEAAARITPTGDMYHYIVKPENAPTPGFFLQHLVNNQLRNVTTDMTTICSFDAAPAAPANLAVRAPGPLYSSAQSTSQSFLRFTNTGSTAGAVALTLRNAATGAWLGRWTSASIAPGAAIQYGITDIEQGSGMTAAKPQYYTAMIESQITGSFAHVLWKPVDGTLTNLSTCDAGVSSNTGVVASVHSSLVGPDYPSTVALTNTGATAQAFTLAVLDARDGSRLGAYTTAAIPAGAQALIAVSAMEAALGLQPTGNMYHYVIRMEGPGSSGGSGFLQHLVNNAKVFVVTDMTTVCQLPVQAVSFTDCSTDNPVSCTATVGGSIAGQLKQPNGRLDYDVRLTAGVSYTVQVKGAASNNGTMQQPYIFIYSPAGGASVAQGGGGGDSTAAADARVTFTPTTSGVYTIRVATYIFDDSAGTFVLTLQ